MLGNSAPRCLKKILHSNGGLESDEFQLAYVPDPESEVDQLRRKAQREDLLQLNRRMRDSHGDQMRRKLFFFGSGVEAYYALDLESREVFELDATFIEDEPLASFFASRAIKISLRRS